MAGPLAGGGEQWESGRWQANLGDEGSFPKLSRCSGSGRPAHQAERIAVPVAGTSKCKSPVVEEVWGMFGEGQDQNARKNEEEMRLERWVGSTLLGASNASLQG